MRRQFPLLTILFSATLVVSACSSNSGGNTSGSNPVAGQTSQSGGGQTSQPGGGTVASGQTSHPGAGSPAGGQTSQPGAGSPAGGESTQPGAGSPAGGESSQPGAGSPAGGQSSQPGAGSPAGGQSSQPGAGTVAGGSPAGGRVGSSAAGGSPAGGSAGRASGGTVAGGSPTGGTPTGGTPTGGTPTGGTPTGGTPIGGINTGGSPVPPSEADYSMDVGWMFIKQDQSGAQATTASETGWTSVSTPHTYNDTDSYRVLINHSGGDHGMYAGPAWYRKHFKVPATFAGNKFIVEFERIRETATFYINGTSVGTFSDGVSPIGVDITANVKADGTTDNVLAVAVDNSGGGEYWNANATNPDYGGSVGHVWLHVPGKIYQTYPLQQNLQTTGVYIYGTDYANIIVGAWNQIQGHGGFAGFGGDNIRLRPEGRGDYQALKASGWRPSRGVFNPHDGGNVLRSRGRTGG